MAKNCKSIHCFEFILRSVDTELKAEGNGEGDWMDDCAQEAEVAQGGEGGEAPTNRDATLWPDATVPARSRIVI